MGSRSMATHMAPSPIANPDVRSSPGRWDRPMPPTAPTNIEGKTGPPRKPPRESPYASDLQASSTSRVPAEYPALEASSGPRASWPE